MEPRWGQDGAKRAKIGQDGAKMGPKRLIGARDARPGQPTVPRRMGLGKKNSKEENNVQSSTPCSLPSAGGGGSKTPAATHRRPLPLKAACLSSALFLRGARLTAKRREERRGERRGERREEEEEEEPMQNI